MLCLQVFFMMEFSQAFAEVLSKWGLYMSLLSKASHEKVGLSQT